VDSSAPGESADNPNRARTLSALEKELESLQDSFKAESSERVKRGGGGGKGGKAKLSGSLPSDYTMTVVSEGNLTPTNSATTVLLSSPIDKQSAATAVKKLDLLFDRRKRQQAAAAAALSSSSSSAQQTLSPVSTITTVSSAFSHPTISIAAPSITPISSNLSPSPIASVSGSPTTRSPLRLSVDDGATGLTSPPPNHHEVLSALADVLQDK